MTEVNSIKEAYHYVNKKHDYNAVSYPAMGKLNDEEKRVFEVNHSLLRVQKHMYDFMHLSDSSWKHQYLHWITPLLIDLLILARSVDISAEESEVKMGPGASVPWDEKMILNRMNIVLDECISSHRGGKFDWTKAKQATEDMLSLFYTKTGFQDLDKLPYHLIQIVRNVPNIMEHHNHNFIF